MPSIQLGEYRFFSTWKVLCGGILCVCLLLNLSLWQIHRGAQKKQLIDSYKTQSKQAHFAWDDTLPYPNAYQPIKLQGHYVAPQFLLDNQFFHHEWGYHVLSPFYLAKTGKIIMIDRGWLKGASSRSVLPSTSLPQGEREILGYTYYPQNNRWISQPVLKPSSDKLIVIEQFLPSIFKSVLPSSVLPFIIRLSPKDPEGWVRDWPVVTLSPSRHFAYAVQWFALAILFCVVFIAVQLKRVQNENH